MKRGKKKSKNNLLKWIISKNNLIKWIIIGVLILAVLFIVFKVFTGFVVSSDSYEVVLDNDLNSGIKDITTGGIEHHFIFNYTLSSTNAVITIDGNPVTVIEGSNFYLTGGNITVLEVIHPAFAGDISRVKILVYPGTPISTTVCTDTDGGRNYYVAGNLTGGGFGNTCGNNGGEGTCHDMCYGSTGFGGGGYAVSEWYCENGLAKHEVVNCQSGYTCLFGACVNSSSTLSSNTSCVDSDGGLNPAIAGQISGISYGYPYSSSDYCRNYSSPADLQFVSEGECYAYPDENGPKIYHTGRQITCPYGCSNSACVNISSSDRYCSDSDNGMNYYTKGKTIFAYFPNYSAGTDFCTSEYPERIGNSNNNALVEFSCGNRPDTYSTYICPNGCRNGACINLSSTTPPPSTTPIDNNTLPVNQIPTPTPSEPEITPPIINENDETVCISGCLFVKSCLPYGYRTAISYCNADNTITKQVSEGTCINNFECTSNVCVEGQCTTPGLFLQFLNWFRALFGVQ